MNPPRCCFGFCLFAILANAPVPVLGADWNYVASPPQGAFARPLFQPVRLTSAVPDIEQEVDYRGTKQRYAMLRYGSPNSLRVAVVVDEISRKDFDLYVDSDRNRTITTDERIPGEGRIREFQLDAEIAHSETNVQSLARRVILRRGITSKSLSFATLGFIEGVVELEGRRIAARRVDGNGDGLFSATRDRVWLDLNEDHSWDAFSEQFPYQPILSLGGRRYALRGDVAGKRLELRELTGTGTVRLEMKLFEPEAEVTSLDVMLVGADGTAVSFQGTNQAVTVPTGKYVVNTVQLSVKDLTNGKTWSFVFSNSDGQKGERTYVVSKGQQVTIDPIGKLRFELKLPEGQRTEPGGSITVRPRLYTEDGLLINSSRCSGSIGASESQVASIWLRKKVGLPLADSRSGFA